MTATTSRRQEGSERFVREINRALVARGQLDPVMQAISDHWTLVLQRLFPVWCVVGPGLADPGHIELTSRTVYLDSDALLGTREEIVAGRLEPRRILATFGVGIHEVCHAKHTSAWVMDRDILLSESDDEQLRQLAVDRRLLEEPRMEATGIREFPDQTKRGVFIRAALSAAVVDVIVPRLAEAMMLETLATGGVSRDLAGRAFVYLGARCGYLLDPGRLGPLPDLWRQALGGEDVTKLEDLCGRLIWVSDGDNDELDRHAMAYRDIIGPPPSPPPSGGGRGQGDGTPSGETSADGRAAGAADESGGTGPTPQSLSAALAQAMAEQRDGQLEQLNEHVDLQTLLKAASRPDPPGKGGRGTGLPTGRLPDRGVNRPPLPDEVNMARQYARRLHQAREVGHKRISKRTPGGKFNSTAHMRGYAQRKLSVPVTAKSWEMTRITRAPIREPHVALVIDTSGSMCAYEPSLGPIAWVLSEGLREFGGRLAIALFGNSAELLSDGRRPLTLVPSVRTGGGTAFASDAITLAAQHLDLEDQHRPRFTYCLSDGAWSDTQTGVKKIRELQDLGVPVVHIAIGAHPPLTVDASRVVTVTDPADAMDLIAQETVDALKARRRR